jgi:hypothetical protein
MHGALGGSSVPEGTPVVMFGDVPIPHWAGFCMAIGWRDNHIGRI